MSISILLVDDHNLFRSGVRQLLQREEDLCIVAEAADEVAAEPERDPADDGSGTRRGHLRVLPNLP